MTINERFLDYSLRHELPISLILLEDGKIKKKKLQVLSLDRKNHVFTACTSRQKTPKRYQTEDILSASYARGDAGEIENVPS